MWCPSPPKSARLQRRRGWRELYAVLPKEPQYLLDVGRFFWGRRQGGSPGRFTHLLEGFLQPRRSDDDQRPALRGLQLRSVLDVSRQEDVVVRSRLYSLLSDLEGELSLQDVVGLVFA